MGALRERNTSATSPALMPDFFSLSKTESEEVIGRWVQKNTGVEVNDVRGIETIHFKN